MQYGAAYWFSVLILLSTLSVDFIASAAWSGIIAHRLLSFAGCRRSQLCVYSIPKRFILLWFRSKINEILKCSISIPDPQSGRNEYGFHRRLVVPAIRQCRDGHSRSGLKLYITHCIEIIKWHLYSSAHYGFQTQLMKPEQTFTRMASSVVSAPGP